VMPDVLTVRDALELILGSAEPVGHFQ